MFDAGKTCITSQKMAQNTNHLEISNEKIDVLWSWWPDLGNCNFKAPVYCNIAKLSGSRQSGKMIKVLDLKMKTARTEEISLGRGTL